MSNNIKKRIITVLAVALLIIAGYFAYAHVHTADLNKTKHAEKNEGEETSKTRGEARVVANGDILIHDVVYKSAEKTNGGYDFDPYFKYVKQHIKSADLAIGDFEGTISDEYPLAGYPLFNAPIEIAGTIKRQGYDVVDLAHNHILDSRLSGAINTVKVFEKLGIDSVGVYKKDRQKEGILIKKVNGIKIAILGYSYGYNGMEATLSKQEYKKHMSDLDETLIKKEIKEAEKKADVTIVMPQMGVEYKLEPTKEQERLYRKMIDWGADVVFGGYPHVVEPAEVIKKGGEKKLIIYSMGNFISNQREETLDNIWTERGVLMDVTFKKKNGKTVISKAEAHPTMVLATPQKRHSEEGWTLYDYRVILLKDFIKGGKYRTEIDSATQKRVDTAYEEMNKHVNLKF